MPKIIENVREQLLAEAKKQISERGYASTTIRSVAGALGLAVGTVYNYFESKEMLIGSFVYEDWKKHLAYMQSIPSDDPYVLISGIYGSLRAFEADNARLFADADAAKRISVGSSDRHKMLRGQISALVKPVCKTDIEADFIAEALISWSVEGTDFDTLYTILEKIIK